MNAKRMNNINIQSHFMTFAKIAQVGLAMWLIISVSNKSKAQKARKSCSGADKMKTIRIIQTFDIYNWFTHTLIWVKR